MSCFADLLPLPCLPEAQNEIQSEIERNYQFYIHRPRSSQLCLKIGNLLEAAGDLNQAISWYEEAAKIDPSSSTIQLLVSRNGWLNRPDQVMKGIKELLQIDPGNLELIQRAAETAEWQKDLSSSALFKLQAFDLSKDPKFLVEAAERYLWGELNAEAKKICNLFKNVSCKDPKLLEKMADFSEAVKDLSCAIFLLERAQEIEPSKSLSLKIAQRAFWNRDLQKAKLLFKQLLPQFPKNYEIICDYAEILDALGEATASFQLINELPTRDLRPSLVLRRAQIRLDRGRFEDARSDSISLIEATDPSISSSFKFYAGVTAGQSAFFTSDFQAAKNFFQTAEFEKNKSKENQPIPLNDHIFLLKFLAKTQRKLGEEAAEEQTLRSIIERKPDDVETLLLLAENARNRKDSENALSFLEKILKLNPDDVYMKRSLAEILIELGEKKRAKPLIISLSGKYSKDPFLKTSLRKILKSESDWENLLPLTWGDWAIDPSRDNLVFLLEPLEKLGHWQKCAELLIEWLRENPFDGDLERNFKTIVQNFPAVLNSFESHRRSFEEAYYLRQIASETKFLSLNPNDFEALERRAQIQIWRGKLIEALNDLLSMKTLRPRDEKLLEKVAQISEWAGKRKEALKLRKELHGLFPGNASNTLRIAQDLGWKGGFQESYTFYRKIRHRDDIDPVERNLSAFPIYQVKGNWKEAHSLINELSEIGEKMNLPQIREFRVFKEELGKTFGPVFRLSSRYKHDTETTDHTELELFLRSSVKDGSRLESRIVDHSFSQDKYGHRDFRGRVFSHSFVFQTSPKEIIEAGINFLHDISSGKFKPLLPSLKLLRKNRTRETQLGFQDDLVLDTPEAVRRGVSLRSLNFTQTRFLDLRNSLSFSAKTGNYNDGERFFQGGIGAEYAYRLSPRRSWRYLYSRIQTAGNGGNVFYSPSNVGTHQVSWIGNHRLHLKQRIPTELSWEMFAGKEEWKALFKGFFVSLEGRLKKNLFWRMEGSSSESTVSHFGGGSSNNQYFGFQIEERNW